MVPVILHLSNALYLIRHPLFIGAPTGVHPVGAPVKQRLNPADKDDEEGNILDTVPASFDDEVL